jgi:hypothetical protein
MHLVLEHGNELVQIREARLIRVQRVDERNGVEIRRVEDGRRALLRAH